MKSDEPIEHELLRQAVCVLEDCAFETTTEHFMEHTRVRVTMQAELDLLESCALGDAGEIPSAGVRVLIALGVLSFHQARPRGNSGIAFAARDEWTVADMLRCLTFPAGRVYFYADYVRGRMMKTAVEIFPDGRIVLETQNRGEAATRWVEKLQGKKVLSLVQTPGPRGRRRAMSDNLPRSVDVDLPADVEAIIAAHEAPLLPRRGVVGHPAAA